MRIAFYANAHDREDNRITIRAISKAYIIGKNKLVCDEFTFWIADKNINDFLMTLLKDGYLDLCFAPCIER